ncbi:hypothetical protein DFQ30_003305 [Apophysomyces sp. BC1015]|nr:hypothetical protein DFQ30_003305 [Apophysomyces sp. BC1015]KAG0178952.1 hypothetical protein DFQ29_002780 [Apophysomyces sp. BC1021]
MVGTKITRKDVLGTFVVVASVIWIVVFGGMYNGDDPEESISIDNLKTLFTRPIFIIYFSALNIITFSGLALAIWSRWALSDDSRKRTSQLFVGMKPKKMRRIVGLMFSLDGGMLASETLLLAKSGSQVNQFTDNTSRFIVLALVLTAILQVYCLNSALKLYSSVVVVPVFYGTYTALGLVNTIIYLDEIGNYPGWAIALVFAGIGVLIYGVFLLSSKPDPSHPREEDTHEPEELSMMTTDAWPSAKDEKEAAAKETNIDLGEASGSHPPPPPPSPLSPPPTNHLRPKGWLARSFMKVKHFAGGRRPGRREMDTFISLQSSTSASVTITVPAQAQMRSQALPSDFPGQEQDDFLRHRQPFGQTHMHSSDPNIALTHTQEEKVKP